MKFLNLFPELSVSGIIYRPTKAEGKWLCLPVHCYFVHFYIGGRRCRQQRGRVKRPLASASAASLNPFAGRLGPGCSLPSLTWGTF